jgi:hypothetical protein
MGRQEAWSDLEKNNGLVVNGACDEGEARNGLLFQFVIV